MEAHGEYLLAASRRDVWDALHDPKILMKCIDGCETMTKTATDSFACSVAIKVGPVKAKFSGTVKIVDPKEPHSYTLEVTAHGGSAGFGSGRAEVALHDDPQGTRLTYEIVGTIGGKLAQIGARLIQSFIRKMSRQFFDRFSQHWIG